jgi:hypothetical protein
VPKDPNWVDLLDRKPAFVVLTKDNRLQVLAGPTRKQLRRRGKRGWSVVAAVDSADGGPVPPDLTEAVSRALEALGGGKQGKEAGPKQKRPSARAG